MFLRALTSGYALAACAAAFTFGVVPLALTYIGRDEFGLWTLAYQFGIALAALDLGMSAAATRFLIDHARHDEEAQAAAVLRALRRVMVAMSVVSALAGAVIACMPPQWFGVTDQLAHPFRLIALATGIGAGLGLPFKGGLALLVARHRYDVFNCIGIAMLGVAFLAIWACFRAGFGVYTVLVFPASTIANNIACEVACRALALSPGRAPTPTSPPRRFGELAVFGVKGFAAQCLPQFAILLQTALVSSSIGLGVAADWGLLTRLSLFGAATLGRAVDYAYPAISDMIARDEMERLRSRVAPFVAILISLSLICGLAVAAINRDFVPLWSGAHVTRLGWADWLLAPLLVLLVWNRLTFTFLHAAKRVGRLVPIQCAEIGTFVVLFFALRPLGLAGALLAVVMSQALITAPYGIAQLRPITGVLAHPANDRRKITPIWPWPLIIAFAALASTIEGTRWITLTAKLALFAMTGGAIWVFAHRRALWDHLLSGADRARRMETGAPTQ